MKKLFITLITILVTAFIIRAQPFVTIPDANFATFLSANYPAAMTGNTLDAGVIGAVTSINVSGLGISDLTGIQYFTNLFSLNCSNNSLNILPPLSSQLNTLVCNNNSITSLSNISTQMCYLFCQNNLLSTLPVLTGTSLNLYCGNNNITCFPTFPAMSQTLDLLPNPFTCLPNHVPAAMNATLMATPICVAGNPFNCPGINAISGNIYKDMNANCVKDFPDLPIIGVPTKLYNNTGSLVAQFLSSNSSAFAFNAVVGTYSVKADTTALPIAPQCVAPGVDSSNIVISGGNPFVSNVNFNFACKPGFDVGSNGHILGGSVFPGVTHKMTVFAGDMANFSNLNCSAGVSGQVIISINGPVTFSYVLPGALTPTIIGNTYTYYVADFANLTSQSFGLGIKTNTNAGIGNPICVNVAVTPTVGDNNLSNNTYTFCHLVGNSYDPNKKDVYPGDVAPGFQNWFTYTIEFQNTGNSPAMNIRLLDTLDNNLDLETFRVIHNSHPFSVALNGRVANFFFPGIMLPDSISNPLTSIGFIQYRIKPKAGLLTGTQIKNKAFIYFDFNPPIVTNTAINNFISPTLIKMSDNDSFIKIYPNPAKNKLSVSFNDDRQRILVITDIIGKEIFCKNETKKNIEIETDLLQNGIYFIKIIQDSQSSIHKIIVEK
jgi:uncharacterized repeat protein (TIGR01451 family)